MILAIFDSIAAEGCIGLQMTLTKGLMSDNAEVIIQRNDINISFKISCDYEVIIWEKVA